MIDPSTITLDEVEQLVARFKKQREMWHGNPGYARGLNIEIVALGMLAARVKSENSNG